MIKKDHLTNELQGIVCDLVQFRTVHNESDEFEKITCWIEEYLSGVAVFIERIMVDGLPNLVITTQKNKCPLIMLQAHLDVVDGADEQFEPFIEGDRLVGRGTADMKGFVAACLYLIRELASSDDPPDIGLMLTCDEEVTGNGAAELARRGYGGVYILNGDGGHCDAVSFAEKGVLRLKFEARTEPGRRSCPWEGESALDVILEVNQRLLRVYCPDQHRTTDSENWNTTFGLLQIKTENRETHLPHWAMLTGRMSFIDDHSVAEYFQLICNEMDDLPVTCTIEDTSAELVYLDPDDQALNSFREKLELYRKCPIGIRGDNGTSDARFFTGTESKIIIFRMPGGRFHSDDEYLDLSSLAPIHNAMCDWVDEIHNENLAGILKQTSK